MKLEDIKAEIRPRRGWEAIDLGCALVRRWIVPLWLSWWITTLPVCILIIGVFWKLPVLALLCLFWIKPVFERVPLFLISRGLFGVEPRVVNGLKAWPRLLFGSFFTYWFGIRFFTWFNRSVYMPIRELEGLRGTRYSSRAAMIGRHAGGYALWLTFACWMIELSLTIGTFAMCFILMPTGLLPEFSELFQQLGKEGIESLFHVSWLWVLRLLFVSWLVALSVVELIYVGAGFGLYLNSRSHQEGWDIELTFRRLANRLRRPVAAVLLIGATCLVLQPAPASAQDAEVTLEDFLDPVIRPTTGDSPEAKVAEVMSNEVYEVHTRINRTTLRQGRNSSLNLPAGLGTLGYIVFWGIVVIIVLGIIFIIYKNRGLVRTVHRSAPRAGPREVMGMDITPESLPDDIVTTARNLWAEGRHQEAISLLYRAAISHLVQRDQLSIRESDTESDCLRCAASGMQDREQFDYFAGLTRTWIGVAYGRILPGQDGLEALCNDWPFARGGLS